MARARLLKPGFFHNEDLAELPFEARLLFAGLWTLADRKGRLDDRPRRIKAEVFPYDAVDVPALLDALEAHGFIERYQVERAHFIQIVNFEKHQHPHVREPASVLPAPESQTDIVGTSTGLGNVAPGARPDIVRCGPAVTEAESVTEAEAETVAETVAPASSEEHPAVLFAQFGAVTAGTLLAVDDAVEDYGIDWVRRAVRVAAGSDFTDRPPWSYVEKILIRWKVQRKPDDEMETPDGPNGRLQTTGAAAGRRARGVDDFAARLASSG